MNTNFRKLMTVALLAVTSVTLGSLVFLGCTDNLQGERSENQAPLVWFANVPPEDDPSSTNPIINWVGQDQDGQVVMFRYLVLTEDEIIAIAGGVAPLDNIDIQAFVDVHLDTVTSVPWTELFVDPIEGEPRTSNIIPMSAKIADPVNIYVRQIVFVQAFDEEGLGSVVVFRAFNRNDNPPNTRIVGFLGGPFIDAPFAGGTVTGIGMRWQGSDIVDYPTDPPPFEFQWRLYGPYYSTFDDFADSTWEDLNDPVSGFIRPVFVTRDAQVYRFGEGLSFEDCDTSFIPDADTFIRVIECITIYVDTISTNNIYGVVDTLLDVEDPDFVNNPLFNRIADSSWNPTTNDYWISGDRDVIYGVFSEEPSDTTQEQYFIFWVRSRDDALVPDLTPAYESFSVIDPKYERDIGVVDVQLSFSVNARIKDSAEAYWGRAIETWGIETGQPNNYDTARDYLTVSCAQGLCVSLRDLLAHKILIIVNDNPFPGLMVNPGFGSDVFTAVDAGVNVWVCGRAHWYGGEAVPPQQDPIGNVPAPVVEYLGYYFGVGQWAYSGWEHIALGAGVPELPRRRIEDFIGALSLEKDQWPDLAIDTALLHRRYRWTGHYAWRPDTTALPEVDWHSSGPGTQPMYLYNSRYGATHFYNGIHSFPNVGPTFFTFQGKPVGHRLSRGLFRTVYFRFTPYAMAETAMQMTVNSILSWLYEGAISSPPMETRYYDARYPTTVQKAREMYWQRMEDKAMEDPELAETFR